MEILLYWRFYIIAKVLAERAKMLANKKNKNPILLKSYIIYCPEDLKYHFSVLLIVKECEP